MNTSQRIAAASVKLIARIDAITSAMPADTYAEIDARMDARNGLDRHLVRAVDRAMWLGVPVPAEMKADAFYLMPHYFNEEDVIDGWDD